MLPLKNYYFKSDYDGWQKFNGGIVPDGYELKSFVHCGLMIRKIKSREDVEKQERKEYERLKVKYETPKQK
jgi:hypothetical protein